MSERELLDWMTAHHKPLGLYLEDGVSIVVDFSTRTVLASGEGAYDALT